jgi:hypothetical protein
MPAEFTIATNVLLLVHVTVLLPAFDGITVGVRVSANPASIVSAVLFKVTPVTGTGFTVTLHAAVLPPSAVIAVTVTVPTAFPVITPAELTVAIAVLLLVQLTVLFAAFDGATVATSVAVASTFTANAVLSRLTPVTAIGVTVTAHVAVFPPSAVFAVIVALPAAFPVTEPAELTVATAVLLLVHATVLFAAFDGATVALIAALAPTLTDNFVLSRLTPVTAIGFTVTFVVAIFPPSDVFAVIVAVPALFPVTTPLELTVATDVLLLDHVSFLFVAHAGTTVILMVTVLPSTTEAVDAAAVNPVTGTLTNSAETYPSDMLLVFIFSHPPLVAV